jgi:hypothetical protein
MKARIAAAAAGLLMLLSAGTGFSQDADTLVVGPSDVRIEQTLEGGYYLYVRKKPGLESVLVTESTEAPDHEVATYALRNPEYHPENGDERRKLDGEFLESDGVYSLIDSTPLPDDEFGEAFRVFIPWVVVYGYDWTRNGAMQVLDGAYLSIRAFELPFADYEGGYRDNPFILRVSQAERADEPTGHLNEAVESLAAVAEANSGRTFTSMTDADVVDAIDELIEETSGASLDLVVAIDTTQSMEDNVPYLQDHLVSMLSERAREKDLLRVGVVYYRDYMEEYLTRRFDFSDDFTVMQRMVDTIRVAGGRDSPEAVYEALYTALTRFTWLADDRLVVLIGDAPPHPFPRGMVTPELVKTAAAERGVAIHTIILPQ